MKTEHPSNAGFTRVDLVALIAIGTVLAALTLPLRGDTDAERTALFCRTNMRQLVRAMHLYTMDWEGYLPPNAGSSSEIGWNWLSGNVRDMPGATNTALLVAPTTSLLADYLQREIRPFQCPAEKSRVRVSSTFFLPRARTVSINTAVGTDPFDRSGPSRKPTAGAWLDGNFGHTANRTWRCFARLSDMAAPRPENVFMFADEHDDSINDANLGNVGPGPLATLRWIDWPAAFHQGGAGFGMADGRAEIHQWVAPATVRMQAPSLPASRPDLDWLAQHTTALVTQQP